MTPELAWLTQSALLAGALWIPFVIGVNATAARDVADFLRPPDLAQMPAWVHRAHRAHLNMIEQLVPFALLVLIAHQAGVSTPTTVAASALFFGLRLAHAVGMITGRAGMPLRPVLFTSGWLCILAMGWSILTA